MKKDQFLDRILFTYYLGCWPLINICFSYCWETLFQFSYVPVHPWHPFLLIVWAVIVWILIDLCMRSIAYQASHPLICMGYCRVWQSFRLWETQLFRRIRESRNLFGLWVQILNSKVESCLTSRCLRKQLLALVYYLNNQSFLVSFLIICDRKL